MNHTGLHGVKRGSYGGLVWCIQEIYRCGTEIHRNAEGYNDTQEELQRPHGHVEEFRYTQE